VNKTEYLVRWKGTADDGNAWPDSWELEKNITADVTYYTWKRHERDRDVDVAPLPWSAPALPSAARSPALRRGDARSSTR
jgi:hypothetical protein